MKDSRIYDALNIITDLLSELHNISIDNFDYKDGEAICLECGRRWYDREHQNSKCKTIKLSKLHEIAITFDEE